MKAVIQRVSDASVTVNGELAGSINFGLLVYIGVASQDTNNDAGWLADKIPNLRIFDDSDGKMNLSLNEIVNNATVKVNENKVNGISSIGILAISQFTLMGDARKGRRPSWSAAAVPEKAQELYDDFIMKIKKQGVHCESGIFQARMKVRYTNEGPVTILLDSKDTTRSEE